ncbi:MAG: hypothetical protein ACPLRW_07230 [Moorellales bacterium]
MRCQHKDCVHYYQGHLACAHCWRGQGLQDRYEPTTPYYEQGRLCNLLGKVWEEYCLSRLSKRHATRVLAYVQAVQALIMQESLV